jgi:uncharacterized protein
VLDIIDGRVLGALIEKQLTTPDIYPLSLNALSLACNQSTAREPVMNLSSHDVEESLARLKEQKLARFVHPSHGRSVTKYRQVCDEFLGLEPGELAVVGLLLLRGPQTSGELRTRSERLHGFDTVAAVETTLAALAERTEPLVVRLERSAGQKEARWRQLLADESVTILGESLAAPSRGSALAALEERVESMESRIARLEAALAELL